MSRNSLTNELVNLLIYYNFFSPGRWVKIDSHQVPKKYFEYSIGKLKAQVNGVRHVSHKAQPSYKSLTHKISYKIFDLEHFLEALEEGDVSFDQDVLYSGNSPVEREQMIAPLSAEEEILRAKQRVHVPVRKRKRPSSKTSLIIGYGEGKATREIELIWWPDLYHMSEHGQMVVRFFLENVNFESFLRGIPFRTINCKKKKLLKIYWYNKSILNTI